MKSKVYKKICLLFVMCFLIMTVGCSTKKDGDSTDEKDVNVQSIEITNVPDASITSKDIDSAEVTPAIAPTATKEVSIYTLDLNSTEIVSKEALVSEDTEITPELLTGLVTDSLSDAMIIIDIDYVRVEEDSVIISLGADSLEVLESSKEMETAILDVLAQSMVDNFITEYPKVIFRIEDKAYTSKYRSLGVDEIYLDGSKSK